MIYKKLFLSLASLITLIAIGVNIFLYQKVMELSDKLALNEVTKEEQTSQPVPDPVEQSSNKAVTNSNTDEIDELKYHLNATEEEIDMVSDQLTEALDENNKGATLEEVQKRLMENDIKQNIDRDFALLYKRLTLSPEDLDEFKHIELEWRLATLQLSDPHTIETLEKAARLRQENMDKFNQEFIDLLGEEKFMIYDDFRNTLQERNEVNSFIADMGPENRISENVAEELIQGMYEARRTIEKEIDDIFNSPDSWDIKNLHMLETQIKVFEKYEEAADNILSPDQAELFNTRLRWIRGEYKKVIKITSLGIEADKNKDEADVKSD